MNRNGPSLPAGEQPPVGIDFGTTYSVPIGSCDVAIFFPWTAINSARANP